MKNSKLRVGITYDKITDWHIDPERPSDFYDEFDLPETVDAIETAIATIGHIPIRIGNVFKLLDFLNRGQRVDIVFNFAEGLFGRSRESQIPAILEAFQIPYTGADAICLGITLDKPLTKRLLQHSGIPTPDFAVIETADDAELALEAIGAFPLFLKPAREGTSKGIGADAIVHSLEDLHELSSHLLQRYEQPVLVEEYLPGIEYTVAIIEENGIARATSAQPINIGDIEVFSNEAKMEHQDAPFILVREPQLQQTLFDLSLRTFKAVECRDLARVDIRCNAKGEPEVMEINPLPHLHPVHSSFMYLGRDAGYTFESAIETIIDNAWQRSRRYINMSPLSDEE